MKMDSAEFARHLNAVVRPGGHPADQLAARESARWLVEHAAESYPVLLDALRSHPTGVDAAPIIDLLPGFARAESIPLLREILLSGAEAVARAAGTSLGRHRGDEAAAALTVGLGAAPAEVRIGAILGWLQRPASEACPVLSQLPEPSEPLVRDYLREAIEHLRCAERKQQ